MVADYIKPTVRKKRTMNTHAQLAFSVSCRTGSPHSAAGFLFSVADLFNNHSCFLRDLLLLKFPTPNKLVFYL